MEILPPSADCPKESNASTPAGRREDENLTFVTTAAETTDVVMIDQRDYDHLRTELSQAEAVTITRRASCPAHDQVDFGEKKNKFYSFFSIIFHTILYFVVILFPPWPPRIIEKCVYRPPPRGYCYHLLYGEGKNSKSALSAKLAFNKTNVSRICLPPMLKKTVEATDVFYHCLRCSVKILRLDQNVHICTVLLTSEMTRLHLPEGSRSPFLIIFFQPNSSDLGSYLTSEPNVADIADFFWCDMLFFDYPGYGTSDGQPTEYHVYRSSELVMEYAMNTLGYSEDQIILMGFSLGTAAAIHLASNANHLGALILMAPFTSVLRVVGNCPRLQASWSFDAFRSIDKASAVTAPTLIVHGRRDRIVPVSHGKEMSAEIADSELIIIEKATHHDLLNQRAMWDAVLSFLNRRLAIHSRFRQAVLSSLTTSHLSTNGIQSNQVRQEED